MLRFRRNNQDWQEFTQTWESSGRCYGKFYCLFGFHSYAVTVKSIYNLTILPACRRAKYASLSSGVLLQSPMANKFSISSTLRNRSTLRLPFFSILSESFDWYAMELTFSPVQRNTRSVSMLVPLSVVSVKGPEIQGLSESNCQKHVSYQNCLCYRWNLSLVNSIRKTAPKSVFWAPSCVPEFEYNVAQFPC